jgi:hypothetical protein
MTIEEIYNSEEISVRSFNVCIYNNLINLTAILIHYRKFSTFENLRNCGRKSNEELTALCLKFKDFGINQLYETINPEKQLNKIITNFTRTQREIINSFIEINTINLSNRSNNAITSFLNGNLKIRNISDKILTNEGFNFQDIKNVGTKTVKELTIFFDSIIHFVKEVAEVDNENDLIVLKNRFFIQKTFSISAIPIEIIESQSIFRLVDFLISKNVIFEKNESIIFLKAFKIFGNQTEITLDKIAEEINITKERVRQIRKSILENLYNNLQFVKNIEDDLYQKYGIDQNQNLINIDENINNHINNVNNTIFSIEFNTFIIYSYISDKFDLVGEIEDILLVRNFNSRDRYNWDNFYLVNKKISCLFNFIDFANDLDRRSNERIQESYNFNFNSYLLSFSTLTNLDIINNISEVAEKILNNEFGIYIDIDDNINFTRNSPKQAHEYAYEALKLLGKPSKVNEITKKVEELNPDYETNEAKVRVSMKRQNGFVPIGRRSIFGLKEWENELVNFKGGTIRSIVSEYLESEIEPKHISEIADYVLNYRPNTYERSIFDNLKADETRTFIFFKNSRIGIQSKKYHNSFIELNQIDLLESKSWKERYNDFVKFICINNRLPFSSGCPNEEIRLYRWFKVQEGKIKKGMLDIEKSDLLSQITIQINRNETKRKRKSKNVERYVDLKKFVFLNNRLPSANKTGEENLYQFFYKQRKLFEQGKLEQSEENQFIEIAKIIQNHKYENKRN